MNRNEPATGRRLIVLAALTAAAAAPWTAVQAQAWPAKPITVVVPFAPGGPTDVAARIVMQRAAQGLGQTVVIENKAGASGQIGTEFVKNAPPDGYTLLVGAAATMTMLPALEPNMKFDTSRDFATIAMLSKFPLMLVVPQASGIRDVKGLVDAMRAKPADVQFGSAGAGSTSHLAAAMFASVHGVPGVHVPYKGTGPALIDLMAGRLMYGFDSPSSYAEHIRAGRLVGLAVTDVERLPALPDVPTMEQAGVKGFYHWAPWNCLFAPRGTPPAVLERLNREVGVALADPAVIKRLNELGLVTNFRSVAQTQALVDEELRTLPALIKKMNLGKD